MVFRWLIARIRLLRKSWRKYSYAWRVSLFLLGVAVSNRFANYSITGVYMDFLTSEWGAPIYAAAMIINVKEVLTSSFAIFGATYATQATSGLYHAIRISMPPFIIGVGLFTVAALEQLPKRVVISVFVVSLLCTAMGEGMQRHTIFAFGYDQFKYKMDDEEKAKRQAYIWWGAGRFVGTVGGLIASSLLIEFHGYESTMTWWVFGGIISSGLAVLTSIIYILGKRSFHRAKTVGKSPIVDVLKVVVAAIRKRHLPRLTDACILYTEERSTSNESARENPGDLAEMPQAIETIEGADQVLVMEDQSNQFENESAQENPGNLTEMPQAIETIEGADQVVVMEDQINQLEEQELAGVHRHSQIHKLRSTSNESAQENPGNLAEMPQTIETIEGADQVVVMEDKSNQFKNESAQENLSDLAEIPQSFETIQGANQVVVMDDQSNQFEEQLAGVHGHSHIYKLRSTNNVSAQENPGDLAEIPQAIQTIEGAVQVVVMADQRNHFEEQELAGVHGHSHIYKLRFLEKASIVESPPRIISDVKQWRLCPLNKVKDAQMVFGLLPLWYSFVIFQVVKSMGDTFFLEQGNAMDSSIFGLSMSLAFLLAVQKGSENLIKILLSLLKKVPKLKDGIPPLFRIGVGLFISICCCIVAGMVELRRLSEVVPDQETTSMSIFWLVPQCFLLGAAIGLAEDGVSDFFDERMPPNLRVCNRLTSESVKAVGALLNSTILAAIYLFSTLGVGHDWIGQELNTSNLHIVYFGFAGLSTVNLMIYIFISRKYGRSKIDNQQPLLPPDKRPMEDQSPLPTQNDQQEDIPDDV